ncbi:MAG: hypothetical protein ACRDRJ_53250 [Streptosporangiaceae bacterium]
MKVYRFRAVISLDAAAPGEQPRQYPAGTRTLMVHCGRIGCPGQQRCLPTQMYRADEQPLQRGDNGVVVTMEVADDEACAFLAPGRRFALWNGADIGHGVISRRVFFTWAA